VRWNGRPLRGGAETSTTSSSSSSAALAACERAAVDDMAKRWGKLAIDHHPLPRHTGGGRGSAGGASGTSTSVGRRERYQVLRWWSAGDGGDSGRRQQ
jgi:hypothetical protein